MVFFHFALNLVPILHANSFGGTMGFLDHGVQSEGTGLELLKVLVGANEFRKDEPGDWLQQLKLETTVPL